MLAISFWIVIQTLWLFQDTLLQRKSIANSLAFFFSNAVVGGFLLFHELPLAFLFLNLLTSTFQVFLGLMTLAKPPDNEIESTAFSYFGRSFGQLLLGAIVVLSM
jgi:hypothetical protein